MTSTQADNTADLELLALYREKGDAQAFDAIMRRYSALVYNTCSRVLTDRSLAEDATQETFYRLMRKPEQVSRCLPAWLHRAATHLCLDMLRSNTARRSREQAYQAELERKRNLTPAEWADVFPQLDQTIADMPEEMRIILIDHFLMGKSQRELSETHHLSPATMSRRMKHAIEELRKKLQSRGIVMSISPLLILLTQYEAQAVPLTLATQLGKLSLFSSTTSSAATASVAAATSGIWVKTSLTVVGGFVIGLAAIGLIGIGNKEPNIKATTVISDDNYQTPQIMLTKQPDDTTTSALESTSSKSLHNRYMDMTASNTDTIYLAIHNPSINLASDIICYIQAPKPGDEMISITYADSHTQTLSTEEVNRLILTQEKRTLNDLLKDDSIPSIIY
ncbi:ECF RNA polymerase sigma factor SigW [Poriferisphaera corsica]|uniref:ECF RNA polymerase sigma factor SigW n=1 Tax=Poriferisphaera corsica TaxID=2528020 RepID=A0A517YQ85_9BACT|nr:sigma-70 family RNA polymerase sigma factor [Poriferisphaera corsica]QDU32377.1 ECF RNA polymerase sigma factor SigW [Poriferisphaera corsica]